MIAFGSSFPGSIREVEVMDDRPMVVQKAGFLAAEEGVELSVFFQKKTGAGFFRWRGLHHAEALRQRHGIPGDRRLCG